MSIFRHFYGYDQDRFNFGVVPISLAVEVPLNAGDFLDLDLLKTHLAVDGSDLDDIITGIYIPAAIDWAEDVSQRSLVARSHVWTLQRFPQGYRNQVRLPRGKAVSVQSVVYSINGVRTQLIGASSGSPAGSDYQEDLKSDTGGVLMPNRGKFWPIVDPDVPAPIEITFTAGYLTSDLLPPSIRHALFFAVSDLLELRGTTDAGTMERTLAQGKTSDYRTSLLGSPLTRFY